VNPKTYLKRLFVVFALIFSVAAGYVVYFNTHYPIPVTDHISFDAKLKFARDNIDPDQVDTLIIGSSIGLNNLLGSVMEKDSKKIKKVLNFSAEWQKKQKSMVSDFMLYTSPTENPCMRSINRLGRLWHISIPRFPKR